MYRQLLQDSPLLIFPLLGLFLFVGAFVVVILRTFTAKTESLQAAAELPFGEGSNPHGDG